METHTLGHALLLQRLGNPYAQAVPSPVQELGALVVAAYVCSRPVSRAARAMSGWWARQWLVYHAIRWGSRHADRESEMRLYIAASWHAPTFRPLGNSGGSDSAGADPLHVLWMHRRMQMGETDDVVMKCHLHRARMDHMAWAEQQGAIVITGDDLTPQEQLTAATAEYADWDRQIRKEAGRG